MNHDPYNPPPPPYGYGGPPPGGYGGAPPGGYGGAPPGGYGGGYPPPPGGYGFPPGAGGFGPQMPGLYEDVNTTLPIVLNAICLSLCCMPVGVAGLILAMQASSAKGLGDYDRARSKAKGATVLAIVTMAACSVIYALLFLLSLVSH